MRRRFLHKLTAPALAASAAAAIVLLLSVAPAGATNDQEPPVSGDDRATAYPGNITANKDGCAQAGLAGDVILQDDNPEGTYFDLPEIPEGFTLTGVVVKGGNAYNVYAGTSTTDLHAPLNPNGMPAGLSHWFACGIEEGETTSTTTTTTTTESTSTESTTTESTTTGSESSEESTTTTSGAAVGSGSEGGLAETGASVRQSLLVAGALLLLGAVMLVATRRRAFGSR